MNKKSWVTASITVFVVAMILEFIYNNYCLKGVYSATASMWRPEAEIMSLLRYYWAALFIASFLFVYIYAKGCESKPNKIGEGLRFGFIVGLFVNLPMATIIYATMPVPVKLPAEMFITSFVEYLILGIVAGLIYKKV